jgi:hypothetical protein
MVVEMRSSRDGKSWFVGNETCIVIMCSISVGYP